MTLGAAMTKQRGRTKKMKAIKWFAWIGSVFVLIMALSACGSSPSNVNGGTAKESGNPSSGAEQNAAETKKLTKIVYVQLKPDLTDIHTDFAKENGIYEKHGIDLDVIHFDAGGPEALAGVAGGDIDMGNFGTPILTGISRGVPIKVVASPAIRENPFVLVGGKKVEKVEDVKGKVLGTGALGGGNHQAAKNILKEYGVPETETDLRPAGGVDAYLLLEQGVVDAVVATEPAVSRIEKGGIGKTIVKAADIEVYKNYQHSFVFASDELIKTNPDAVRAVLAGHKEAIEYAKEHVEELIAYASEKLGYEEDLVRDYYQKIIPTWIVDGNVNVEGTLNAFEILKDLNELDKNFDTAQENWLNLSFLPGSGK